MNKYKVLSTVDIEGTVRTANDVVELSEEAAAAHLAAGVIEIVPEASADTSGSDNANQANAAAPAGQDTAAPGASTTGEAASAAAAPRLVTEEDLAANPILVELAGQVGDIITLSRS